jgi:uncharacterized repeat protein (TIGR04138 family)
MQPVNFDEVLERMTSQELRYHREAYIFLRDALDFTQTRLLRGPRKEPRHVSGQELLGGMRDYALAQYGPMAKTVLNEWGIRSSEDVGELVFQMVEHGLLTKTDQDTHDDFRGGLNFDEAFCKPFRPRGTDPLPTPPEAKAG